MINTSLYKLSHGSIEEIEPHVTYLERYFKNRREQVAQVTLTPNFGVDHDITSMIHMVFPDLKDIKIYKGCIVELRMNYVISNTDAMWLFPQLFKTSGLIELPPNLNLEQMKAQIRDIKEFDIHAFSKKSDNMEEYELSPLNNSIGIYVHNDASNDWGTVSNTYVLGYNLSCDKLLLHPWKYLLDQNLQVHEFFKRLKTMKIEGQTIKNILNESSKGIVEFLTGKPESMVKYITEMTTNWFFENDQTYFFFNSCCNLLSLSSRPIAFETSPIAGIQLYKNDCNSQHPFYYLFPVDTKAYANYHIHDNLTYQQKERINMSFYWDRNKIPFNTRLMRKCASVNTGDWKRTEQKLQVVPLRFYKVYYSRVSSHNLYSCLPPDVLIQLQPGDINESIYFPLNVENIIVKTLIEKYDELERYNVVNEKYYCPRKKMLKIPRQMAKIILNKSS